jgi:hypothetical protein
MNATDDDVRLGIHAFSMMVIHVYAEHSAEIFSEQMLKTATKGIELVEIVEYLSRDANASRLQALKDLQPKPRNSSA